MALARDCRENSLMRSGGKHIFPNYSHERVCFIEESTRTGQSRMVGSGNATRTNVLQSCCCVHEGQPWESHVIPGMQDYHMLWAATCNRAAGAVSTIAQTLNQWPVLALSRCWLASGVWAHALGLFYFVLMLGDRNCGTTSTPLA